MESGDLNDNVPLGITRSGTIRRRGLIGIGVALLEEVLEEVLGFEVSNTQACFSVSFCSCCLMIWM